MLSTLGKMASTIYAVTGQISLIAQLRPKWNGTWYLLLERLESKSLDYRNISAF